MSVAENLLAVRARIERAAVAAGRDPKSVRLVAVSKTKPADAIREAYAAGQRAFGENYAQELVEKAGALADLTEIEWHFIGHLQTNKAKLVARFAHVVHTVHKPEVARELAKRLSSLGRAIDVLAEVNVTGETQKSGARPLELDAVLAEIETSAPTLRLKGLMTMPPADDLAAARLAFDELRALRDRKGGVARLPELSMGMSGDLEVAVAAGATLVRVGTAVFGERQVSA